MHASLPLIGFINDRVIQLALIAPAILLAVTFHEYAHGAVANLLGDPTAKNGGRLSLNPLKHLDPLGTLMFIIFSFGWGKPVPVDGRYFKRPRIDMAMVSLAGPATNFALAAVLGLVIKSGLVAGLTATFILFAARINIVLGVFNLFPFPPLDGSRLISAILPNSLLKHYQALEGYGVAIIFVALYFRPGSFSAIFEPFINFFTHLFLV